MNKLSFFYKQQKVFEMSLKALQRRKFAIIEADEKNGIIKAKARGSFIKPGGKIELRIAEVNERLTTMNIDSKVGNSFFRPPINNETMETGFIRTLYNCFDTM
jgi:hypothetical protein